MKIKRISRILAVLICLLIVFEAGAIAAPVSAQEETAAQPLMQVPGGFDKLDFRTLNDSGKLTLSDTDSGKLNSSEKYSGVLLSGNADKLANVKINLSDELDFGEMKVSRIVINAVAPRKTDAQFAIFLDGADTPSATVALPKQNKKGTWTVSKNLCADLTALKLTGKHKVAFSVVYDSSVGSAATEALLRSAFFTAQSVPVMDVNIDETEGTITEMNNDSEHKTECYGSVTMNVPDGYKSEYSDKTFKTETYELEYIRGRGNSTWYASKKPYKLKFEKKQDFFGMGANKHWVLLANYYDYTMLRNKYTYWLANAMGMEYSPKCVFVDLVMNNQYLGSYYLCEQVRVGKTRVDIDDLEDTPDLSEGDGITGGYLLSLGYEETENRMVNTNSFSFFIENPDFTDYVNEAQYNYISDYLKKTDEAINSSDFCDSSGVHYSEYLDVDAAVGYYLVQEFSMNGDAFGSGSTYLYKKRNGKLYWGPLWDFDYVAWGATEFSGNSTDEMYCSNTEWFRKLFRDPDFMAKFKSRWSSVKTLLEKSVEDGGQLDIYAKQLYMSQKANYYVADTYYNSDYTYGFGTDYYAADSGESSDNVVVTYDSEVQRFRNWISERTTWFDSNIDTLVPTEYDITFMVDGKNYSSYKGAVDYLSAVTPDNPTKKGYVFDNWYTKANGWEQSIDDYDLSSDTTSITFYAKWKKGSPASGAKKIAFPYKDIYLPGNYYYSYYSEADSYTIPISIMPFSADKSKISWSISDSTVATLSGDTITPLVSEGDITVTAKLGTQKITCNVHIGDYYDDSKIAQLVNKSVTVKQGNYAQVKLKNLPESLYAIMNYTFTSADSKIVDVDSYGFIYGKKAGTTYVAVSGIGESKVLLCKITVKPAPLKKGSKFTASGLNYKVTKTGKTGTVTLLGAANKKITSLNIPAAAKAQGKKYKITAIAAKAFKGFSKLTKVAITSKTIKRIGKGAFKTGKKIEFKLPKTKSPAYKKLLKKAGAKFK